MLQPLNLTLSRRAPVRSQILLSGRIVLWCQQPDGNWEVFCSIDNADSLEQVAGWGPEPEVPVPATP